MKKVVLSIFLVLMIGVLGACGSNNNKDDSTNKQNDVTDNPEVSKTNNNVAENEDTDSNKNNEAAVADPDKNLDMSEKMGDLNFAEIEVEIDYGNDKEYEAEVEKKASGDYEAKVEDELANTYLKGQEAFDHLYPILQKLDVNPDSTKEDVISTVLNAFELEDNYKEFEVEITFSDGTKQKYEDKK